MVLALRGRGVVGLVCVGVLALTLLRYTKKHRLRCFFDGAWYFLLTLGNARGMDIAQFPSHENEHK